MLFRRGPNVGGDLVLMDSAPLHSLPSKQIKPCHIVTKKMFDRGSIITKLWKICSNNPINSEIVVIMMKIENDRIWCIGMIPFPTVCVLETYQDLKYPVYQHTNRPTLKLLLPILKRKIL